MGSLYLAGNRERLEEIILYDFQIVEEMKGGRIHE